MDLETELRRVLDLSDAKVPMFLRGGEIEVDDPDSVSPEDAAAQMQAMSVPQVPTGPASPGEPTKMDKVMKALPETWPGQLIGDAIGAVKTIGDAAWGKEPIRVLNPDTGEFEISDRIIKAATDGVGMAQLGGAPMALARGAAGMTDDALRSGFGSLPKGKITTKLAGGGGVADNKTLREMVDKGVASARTMPDGEGFIVYHGSPHDFDRFSMDKIGTGEGAQAYGHGLYFAENESVARGYRDTLAKQAPVSTDLDTGIIQKLLKETNGDRAAVKAELMRREGLGLSPKGRWAGMADRVDDVPYGRMYEVRINADPEQFLDWDKPLSEQSEFVRNAMPGHIDRSRPVGDVLKRGMNNQLHGGDLIGADRATPDQISQALADKGIPGIKYLDAGSRAAGDGSRNYVVFDDKLIEIIRKYGLAAVIGGGAAAGAGNSSDPAMAADKRAQ